MPSYDEDPMQLEFILPDRTNKRMSEKINSPSVALRTNRSSIPKDCDADIASGKASPDNSETLKDSGTEKAQLLEKTKFSDPLQRLQDESDEDDDAARADEPNTKGYFAETVDFPDSPLHLKLLKKRNREAQGLDVTDDDEEESTTFSIMNRGHHGQHRPRRERPTALATRANDPDANRRRKITVNPDALRDDDVDRKSIDSLSNRSDVVSPVDDLATPDDIDTPDDLDDDLFDTTEDIRDDGNYRTCVIGGEERRIDMKVIEPYKKVLSHGGYIGSSTLAIIVFGACYLPDRSRLDYDYVMDNLFLYVLTTLDQLVAQDYVLVYLHGTTSRSCMPSFGWLKRCYQMIDRRLRKNLKGLYLVHPTFWLKTIVIMTKPFISSKFSRKLRFVNSLQELEELIPMDHVCIPDKVREYDEKRLLEA